LEIKVRQLIQFSQVANAVTRHLCSIQVDPFESVESTQGLQTFSRHTCSAQIDVLELR